MDGATKALLAFAVAIILIVPAIRFLRSNFFPRSVIFIDHNGKELGEISPERVQQADVKELERMYERVRDERHLRIRTVA